LDRYFIQQVDAGLRDRHPGKTDAELGAIIRAETFKAAVAYEMERFEAESFTCTEWWDAASKQFRQWNRDNP
jgi:hypothetical protein